MLAPEIESFKFRKGNPDDAPLIAKAVMEAVGEEIVLGMAGTPSRISKVKQVFTNLAASPHSQYSYRNSLVATSPEGEVAGIIVAYDGSRLVPMREEFIKEANAILGFNLHTEDFTDETTPDEFYIDSLYVFPAHRRKGLGASLIEEASRRMDENRKPLGLLVDPDNPGARRLYDSLGFRQVGVTPFAGVRMNHLQKEP